MSATSSTVNLTKTIVGAGMLAIPFAFCQDGILVGSAMTVVAALASLLGFYILYKSSHHLENPKDASFFSLCTITYPNLSLLFDFSLFIQCFGVGLSYVILVGDLFPGLFGHTRELWICLSAIIIVPLCFLKKLDSLKYSSILGLVAIAYLLGMIVTGSITITRASDVSYFNVVSWGGLLSTFPIIVFAYTGSMNLFSILNELHDSRDSNKVMVGSVAISCAIFLIAGICGYITFGSTVQGNLILNYDPQLFTTKLGKFMLGFMVVFSFPLMLHPCRLSANNMWHWIEQQRAETNLLLPSATVPFSRKRFNLVTVTLLAITYALALNVTSFALVLSLVGATGSTAISFILPGMFGMKLCNRGTLLHTMSTLLTIFGFITMVVCVTVILHDA